jgi:NADPH:quinone reductase-like Zn-dependent oxidoreductase
MKAITYTQYGSPDVLHFTEAEKPAPGNNEILIKVYATSINDWDWGMLRGKPFIIHLLNGLFKPKIKILGSDIAGIVEAVGSKAGKFKPGDEVFGDISGQNWGGFAEYACADENRVVKKPASMTFEQAAAIPQGGCLALQSLTEKIKLQPGQKVLINGAGGGSGSFAIQIAKSCGVEVTAVDSTTKLDKMRELGADHVVDYTKEDFTKNGQQYDLIVDLMGFHPVLDYKHALCTGGTHIMVGGSMVVMFRLLLLSPLVSLIWNKRMRVMAQKPLFGMDRLIELFEAGKVMPVIDKVFPLPETAGAFRHFGEGHPKGKVVVTLEQNN